MSTRRAAVLLMSLLSAVALTVHAVRAASRAQRRAELPTALRLLLTSVRALLALFVCASLFALAGLALIVLAVTAFVGMVS